MVDSAAMVSDAASGWRAAVLQVESATTSASTRPGSRYTISWAMLPPRLSPPSTTGAPSSTLSSSAAMSSTASSNRKCPVSGDSP
jgi:hypothetical protein